MNRRMRHKRAAQLGREASAVWSLWTVVQHAKPSFHTLSRGARRRVLYDALTRPWGLALTQADAKQVMRLEATP